MQKFSSQLPKEDLKKFAKEVGKKLVASDFKNNRVEDPTKISEKQEKKVKKYVRDYFEKAVEKKKAIDRKRRERAKAQGINGTADDKEPLANGDVDGPESLKVEDAKDDLDIEMSDLEEEKAFNGSFNQPSPSIPGTPSQPSQELKRKREDEMPDESGEDTESHKRLKDGEGDQDIDVSPPPPPPPPPSSEMPDMSALQDGEEIPDMEEETEEQKEMRLQEEELMRENEEALRMDLDGTLKAEERDSKRQDHKSMHYPVEDMVGMPAVALSGTEEVAEEGMKVEHERKGVLSH
jgi:hypothetical protein